MLLKLESLEGSESADVDAKAMMLMSAYIEPHLSVMGVQKVERREPEAACCQPRAKLAVKAAANCYCCNYSLPIVVTTVVAK